MLEKNKTLKMLKQSQGKKTKIPAMLNEDGIIITERKVIVEQCVRFYKDLCAVLIDVWDKQ